jgi:hypothetical protein
MWVHAFGPQVQDLDIKVVSYKYKWKRETNGQSTRFRFEARPSLVFHYLADHSASRSRYMGRDFSRAASMVFVRHDDGDAALCEKSLDVVEIAYRGVAILNLLASGHETSVSCSSLRRAPHKIQCISTSHNEQYKALTRPSSIVLVSSVKGLQ